MKFLNKITLLRAALVLCFTALSGAPIFAQPIDAPRPRDKQTMNYDKMDRCRAMMEQQEKRVAGMQAEDAALAAQVAAMNKASEKEKPALLAAIVTRLVENRTESHVRMSEMQAEMMPHMMDHMSQGNGSMESCPMMKGMGDKSSGPRKMRH
jgi:hypothetical protein